MWVSLISSVEILSTKPETSQKRKNSASRQQCQLLPEFPAYQLPQWQDDIPKDQFSSVVQSCLTVCDPMDCSTPGLPVHHQVMSTESVMPCNHLILCHPLLLLPSSFPSIRVFSSESSLHIRWPNYWSFSFSISPSNEYSGLIFFRMNWLDLLAVQGTVNSLLQHHSSKASVLWHSPFFIVQLSLPYIRNNRSFH